MYAALLVTLSHAALLMRAPRSPQQRSVAVITTSLSRHPWDGALSHAAGGDISPRQTTSLCLAAAALRVAPSRAAAATEVVVAAGDAPLLLHFIAEGVEAA
jgi:hypothetical protein